MTRSVQAREPYSPESRLILACAKTHFGDEDVAEIRALSEAVVSWDEVLEVSRLHHVVQLLYAGLRAAAPCAVPAEVLAVLRQQSLQTMQRNIYLGNQLVAILRRLEELGLPAVPYKGPVLAAQAYGNIGLRQFGDIDIIIRREDFQRASDALVALGFQPFDDYAPGVKPRSFATYHDYLFIRPDDQMLVEIQWTVVSGIMFPITYETLREGLAEIVVLGSVVPSIAVEQQLLMLCIHGSNHFWRRLMWVCDIAELLRRSPNLKWEKLFALADRLGGRRMLATGLLLARELVGAPLPASASARCDADRRAVTLAQQISDGLLRGALSPYDTTGHRRLYYLSLMGSLPDRLRLALKYYRRTRLPLQAIRKHGFDAFKRLMGR